jgi:MFS family permease
VSGNGRKADSAAEEWGGEGRKWTTLWLLAIGELLVMGLWFSASVVAPVLQAEWRIAPGQAAWLTMSVQLGFVAGALLSAFFNVADVWTPKRVVAAGAAAGAACTAAIAAFGTGFAITVALRAATGMALALVYPVGMKIMATWTREDRGLALGLLVGALTVGTASPHLFRALGGIAAWRPVLYAAAALALGGGLLVWRFGDPGPYRAPTPRFQVGYMARALTVRPLRLANFGYFGHMWELYAMWTWLPAFLAMAYGGAGWPDVAAPLVSFTAIGLGGLGSLAAGFLADRWGRTRTTILSMATSGGCALVIGPLADVGPWLVTALALLWGFAVVADSAQFSTSVTELAEPDYAGTLLTTQTAVGFLLTIVTIRLLPAAADAIGWRWAFATLAVGPALGSAAMWLLRRSPEAARLAGGRR